MSETRYINPYTDFGFKKLFGTAMNKDLLISFLNALFDSSKKEIEDVEYLNAEHLGDGYGDRRAIFDVYCKAKDGSRFIVEMQKAEQENFKDRSLYYSTFAIREQAQKGKKWDYYLNDVYTVGVLNFRFPEKEYPADSYRHEVKLKDVEDNHVFYEKLTFVYLEMPKFNKSEEELETMFDKWMFVLRNLSRLLERPKALQERVFKKLFEQAEIAQYTPEERREYEASVKDYWDYYSTMKTAEDKARAEGRAEGEAIGEARGVKKGEAIGEARGVKIGEARGVKIGENKKAIESACKMKADGMSAEIIAKYLGLSIDEIEKL